MFGDNFMNSRCGRPSLIPDQTEQLWTSEDPSGTSAVHGVPAAGQTQDDTDPLNIQTAQRIYYIDANSRLVGLNANNGRWDWTRQLTTSWIPGGNFSSVAVSQWPIHKWLENGSESTFPLSPVWIYALDAAGQLWVMQDEMTTHNRVDGYEQNGKVHPVQFENGLSNPIPDPDNADGWTYALGSPVCDPTLDRIVKLVWGGHESGGSDELCYAQIRDTASKNEPPKWTYERNSVPVGGGLMTTPVFDRHASRVYVVVVTDYGTTPPTAVLKGYNLLPDQPYLSEMTDGNGDPLVGDSFSWYDEPSANTYETMASPVYHYNGLGMKEMVFVSTPSAVCAIDADTLRFMRYGSPLETPFIIHASTGYRISSQIVRRHCGLPLNKYVTFVTEVNESESRIRAFTDDVLGFSQTPSWTSALMDPTHSQPYLADSDSELCVDIIWQATDGGLYAFRPFIGPGQFNPNNAYVKHFTGLGAGNKSSVSLSAEAAEMPWRKIFLGFSDPAGEPEDQHHVQCFGIPGPVQEYSISGTVYRNDYSDTWTDVPFAGVTVDFEGYSTTSTSDGTYIIEHIPSGTSGALTASKSPDSGSPWLFAYTSPPPHDNIQVNGNISEYDILGYHMPLPESEASESWSQYGHDEHHSHASDVHGAVNTVAANAQPTIGNLPFEPVAYPDNPDLPPHACKVYATGADGSLYKFNPDPASQYWTEWIMPFKPLTATTCTSSPAVGKTNNPLAPVCAFYTYADAENRVYLTAVTTSGIQVSPGSWPVNIGAFPPNGTPFTTSPLLTDYALNAGTVFTTAINTSGGYVGAYDRSFGAQLGASQVLAGCQWISSPVFSNGKIYFAAQVNPGPHVRVYSCTPTSGFGWPLTSSPPLSGLFNCRAPLTVGFDGDIILSAEAGLFCLWADLSAIKWTESPVDDSSFFQNCTPAIDADGNLYIGRRWLDPSEGWKAVIECRNPSGSVNWTSDIYNNPANTSPAITSNGILYFTSVDSLYVLDTSAPGLPTTITSGMNIAFSGPIVAPYGNVASVYVGTALGLKGWRVP